MVLRLYNSLYQFKTIDVLNSQAIKSILERVHKAEMRMFRTAELDMRDSALPEDFMNFLANAAWIICSTYHTVLKAPPGAIIFVRDVLFDIPYVAKLT